MSGPRPSHQYRRGAIYAVRFRIPADLVGRLQTAEFARSLGTGDPRLARCRTTEATTWFRALMERARAMSQFSRADLVAAGDAYFSHLIAEAKRPRSYDATYADEDIALNIEASHRRIEALEDQLRAWTFDGRVHQAALWIAQKSGTSLEGLSAADRMSLFERAARAELQQMRFVVHSLTNPGEPFDFGSPTSTAFSGSNTASERPLRPQEQERTLSSLVDLYLERRKRDGLSQSSLAETTRVLTWLTQALGSETPITGVTPDDMRTFRDGLQRLDVRFRGLTRPFLDRQTHDPKNQGSPQLATRYWSSTKAFFAWLLSDRRLQSDPAAGMMTAQPVHRVIRKPEAFSNGEVEKLLKSPLYAGHKSPRSLLTAGDCHDRGSYWWSGIIGLHTGMRAGEIAQLEIGDFDFGAAVPVIHVRPENEAGEQTKTVKTAASVRDIPISPVLTALELQVFVASRSKAVGTRRVFPDIPLGSRGRKSDGLTKFWARYLRAHGLWKPGRAVHVFRHTLADAFRRAEVPDETLAAVLGHARTGVTGGYGSKGLPPATLAAAIEKIDYGIDIPALIDCQEAAI